MERQQRQNNEILPTASTMKEVLDSIPDFSVKPRRRNNKKTSTEVKIAQTREGCLDLETPHSILADTNVRALLNKSTFSTLPPLYQYKLAQLLPSVDRPPFVPGDRDVLLDSSVLNNEYIARACNEWQKRLSEGEFTPKNQLKLKAEAEREKRKLDPWKLKHFEPLWGGKFSTSPQEHQSATTPLKNKAVATTSTVTQPHLQMPTSTDDNTDIVIETNNCNVDNEPTTSRTTTLPLSVKNTCNNVTVVSPKQQFMTSLKRSPQDDGTHETVECSSDKYLKWG